MKTKINDPIGIITFESPIISYSIIAESACALLITSSKFCVADLEHQTIKELHLGKESPKIVACNPLVKDTFALAFELNIDIYSLKEQPKLIKTFNTTQPITCLAWNIKNELILAFSTSSTLDIWNFKHTKLLCSLQSDNESPISNLCWLRKDLLAAAQANVINVWDITTGTIMAVVHSVNEVKNLECDYENSVVIVYIQDNSIVRYNISAGVVESNSVFPYKVLEAKFVQHMLFYLSFTNVWSSKYSYINQKLTLQNVEPFHVQTKQIKCLEYAKLKDEYLITCISDNTKLVIWKTQIGTETLDEAFLKEVAQIKELSNVEVLNTKERQLQVKLKINEDWIILNITIPYMYPMYIAPVIKIIKTSKNLDIVWKNIESYIPCIDLSLRDQIQYISNKLKDPSRISGSV